MSSDHHRPPPCLYFQRGYCARGETCKYSHAALNAGNILPASSFGPVCEYYKQGCCRFGDKCRSYHPVAVESEALVPEKSHLQKHAPSLPPDSQAPVLSSVCKFYSRGRCNKGRDCPFIHSGGEPEDKSPMARVNVLDKKMPGDRKPVSFANSFSS